MSFRSNLSPDQKMAIIVAGWALVMGATVVTLYGLTAPKPDPVPVTPQPVGGAVAAPPTEGAPQVFTAPGAPLPPPPGTVNPAAPPQTFTAPGVAPQGVPQPGMQPQSVPGRGPMSAPPRIASSPNMGMGNRPMPVPQMQPPRAMNGGGPLPMLPPPPMRNNGSRASVPSGAAPPVNAPAQRAFEAGSAALRAGNKNKAAAEFARAVQLAPDNLPSRLNLASVYLDLKQPARAVPHLREVVKRDPKNVAVQFTLARALLADKKLDEALPYLKKTVQLAPKERQARVILAQVQFDRKQPQEAYKLWAALAQENPKDIEAQMQAAALANDVLQKPADAEKWLRRAVAAAPREPQPALMLGQVLLGRKDARGAAAVLTKAARANPDSFQIYPLLADARTAAGDTKGAASALQSAISKLPNGKTDAQKTEIRATEGALRLALGRTLGASKQTREARAQFEKAAQLLPRDPQPRALGAIAALQLKDNAGAIQGFKSALALDPKRLDDRKTLAQLLAQGKNWKEADAQFALYNGSKPGDAEALLQWASVAAQLKNPKRVAQVLSKAVGVAPKNAAAWTQLALAQRESGDKKGALASFKQLNNLKPGDADVLYETARLQSELGDNTAAYGNFKTVISARPQATEAYPALLQAADKAGQGAGARQFLVNQMAKKENLAAMKQVLDYYQGKNETGEARAFLTDLVSRAPGQDGARTALNAMKGAAVEPASLKLPPITPKVNLSIVPKATPTTSPTTTATPTASPTQTAVAALNKTLKPAKQPVPSPTSIRADASEVKHSAPEFDAPLVMTKPTP